MDFKGKAVNPECLADECPLGIKELLQVFCVYPVGRNLNGEDIRLRNFKFLSFRLIGSSFKARLGKFV